MCRSKPRTCGAADDAPEEVIADVPDSSDSTAPMIDCFRNLATTTPLPEGGFSVVRRIASGIAGDVFHCRDVAGRSLAVKKVPNRAIRQFEGTEADERRVHFRDTRLPLPPIEDPANEAGVLRYLSQLPRMSEYLIALEGVFSGGADQTWIATELCDAELFYVVSSRGALPLDEAKQYFWQLLDAVHHLHTNSIAHRDISLENILLKNGTVRLMDFGVATRSHSSSGVAKRFFRPVGKDFYRAPEAWLVELPFATVEVPERAAPGDIVQAQVRDFLLEVKLPAAAKPGSQVRAQLMGYEAAPCDAFACGIALFIMVFGSPAFARASVTNPTFNFMRTHGVTKMVTDWGLPMPSDEAMEVILGLVKVNPAARWSIERCLDSDWLQDLGKDTLSRTSKAEEAPLTMRLAQLGA